MNDETRIAAARAALEDNPPLPTDGQVIREAMSRLVPIAISDAFERWRTCPERRCRREGGCLAPQMQCAAAPRLPTADIETTHPWLAARLREELLEILLVRALRAGEEGAAPKGRCGAGGRCAGGCVAWRNAMTGDARLFPGNARSLHAAGSTPSPRGVLAVPTHRVLPPHGSECSLPPCGGGLGRGVAVMRL
jgi:hypothetical protein